MKKALKNQDHLLQLPLQSSKTTLTSFRYGVLVPLDKEVVAIGKYQFKKQFLLMDPSKIDELVIDIYVGVNPCIL